MITIGVIIIFLLVFVIAGLLSISNTLEIVVKYQNEMIKLLKNSKK